MVGRTGAFREIKKITKTDEEGYLSHFSETSLFINLLRISGFLFIIIMRGPAEEEEIRRRLPQRQQHSSCFLLSILR